MKLDLHVHTCYSKDSNLELDEIVDMARRRSLDGVAITDHDTMEGCDEIEKFPEDITVIRGMEISTKSGELLGLFLEDEIKSREPKQVIKEIKEQGGLIIVPHPFDIFRNNRFKKIDEIKDLIDGVEVFNSRVIWKGNEEAETFAEKNNMIKTAGSDAHTKEEVGNAYVEAGADSLEEFKQKLIEKEVNIEGRRGNLIAHLYSSLNKLKYFKKELKI